MTRPFFISRMKIAGTLGDLVKESTDAAAGCLRSKAIAYGVKPAALREDRHSYHLPEGVTAKDRLSAGPFRPPLPSGKRKGRAAEQGRDPPAHDQLIANLARLRLAAGLAGG